MNRESTSPLVDFLKAFLITTHEQRLAILRNITKSQCAKIRQVAYNLLFKDSLELKSEDRQYLKRHATSVKELASRRVCLARKRAIIVHKHLLIKRIAKIAVEYLLS